MKMISTHSLICSRTSRMAKVQIILVLAFARLQLSSAEKCDPRINPIDEFPDGYRAIMTLPVMESGSSWSVSVDFDKNVRTLDVPHADIQGRMKNGSHFVLTSLKHNGKLSAGANLSLEFVVHHSRYERPRPVIKKMKFAGFSCKPEDEFKIAKANSNSDKKNNKNNKKIGACAFHNTIPECHLQTRLIRRFSGGYRMEVTIPITKTVSSWTMVLIFSRPITVLGVTKGDIVSNRNSTEYKIANKVYNGELKSGTDFKFEVAIYYKKGPEVTIESLILDPAEFICSSPKYVTRLQKRYKTVAKVQGIIQEDTMSKCKDNLRYIDRFTDGYRASFKVPIFNDLNGWRAVFEFDGLLTAFDVPIARVKGSVKSGSIFVLGNLKHNRMLKKDSQLDIEFTVHYPKGAKRVPKIRRVELDEYTCDSMTEGKNAVKTGFTVGINWVVAGCFQPTTLPPTTQAPTPPSCSAFFKRTFLWADGEKGVIKIPVARKTNGWKITVGYSRPILTFDVHQADKVSSKDGVLFVFKNKVKNAKIKPTASFDFHITVHYLLGLDPRPQISLVKFGHKVICKQ